MSAHLNWQVPLWDAINARFPQDARAYSPGRQSFVVAVEQPIRDALAAAQRENERLRYALEGLVDDEECRFDHHGNCQTHYLGNPCEMATARAVLRGEEANG